MSRWRSTRTSWPARPTSTASSPPSSCAVAWAPAPLCRSGAPSSGTPGSPRHPGIGHATCCSDLAHLEVCHRVVDDPGAPAEEVEVAPVVRLHDVVLVQTPVAALVLACRRCPFCAPARQLGLVDQHVECPRV